MGITEINNFLAANYRGYSGEMRDSILAGYLADIENQFMQASREPASVDIPAHKAVNGFHISMLVYPGENHE